MARKHYYNFRSEEKYVKHKSMSIWPSTILHSIAWYMVEYVNQI